MSKRLILLNLVLVTVAAVFAVELGRELSGSQALPSLPRPRPGQVASPPAGGAGPAEPAAGPDQRPLFNVVAARNLFSPSRTEAVASAPGAAAPTAAKPLLHGVVLDDGKSRAYLEDPTSKKVFGYAVGDTVGGGKLETIKADRVVIARPEGTVMEVMLRDPSKPAPAAPAVTAGAPAVRPNPFLGLIPTAPSAPPAVPAPSVQGTPAPPRLLQQLSPDFFRRPTPSQITPEQPQRSGG